MNRKIQTTMHISENVRDRFKEIAGAQNRDMSKVVEELMKSWSEEHSAEPRTERAQMDHAVSLLAKAVTEHLSEHTEWAMESLIAAGMGLPGSNVFSHRIAHFSAEKQELGKRLAHWVLLRSISFIEEGKRVFVVCDSGTTVFWFLKALGEAITEHFTQTGRRQPLRQLIIVTNNIPGAESFVTYASLHTVNLQAGKTRISDMVECRILAGTFLPEYVAITGKDTEADLDSYAKQARLTSQRDQRGTKSAAGCVFIGITTGNWITLQDAHGTALPFFFARGRSHGSFKKKLLDVCDEVFVMAPLGKLLVQTSVDMFNELLQFTPNASNPQDRSYELVSPPARKARQIKVVSTIREKQSILRDHSALLCKALRHYTIVDLADPKALKKAGTPISDVEHLLFPFDQFSEMPTAAQIEIELPHPKTRTARFKLEIFSIRS